ncbi:MAG: hypothetical protein ABSF53_13385 [Terracidiphilus sp.]
MSDPHESGVNAPIEESEKASTPEPHPRAIGSPLPMGGRLTAPSGQGDPGRAITAPPPGRAIPNPSTAGPFDMPSSVQKAVSALRSALPWVQRILPLLDGNIGTAVSNMLVPQHTAQPHHPPAPPVDLEPLQNSLVELQTQHRDLRTQMVEQNSSLKRVEDQLDMVREATDRNTLEQQELMEDLKVVGNKVNLFAIIALGLLAISVLVNIVLYLHILRVLP